MVDARQIRLFISASSERLSVTVHPSYNFQVVVVDCDHRRLLSFLARHVGLLQADGQAEVFTGPKEAVHGALQLFLRMGRHRSSIGKKDITDESLAQFGLCLQTGSIRL